jgi:hypothetical protein
LNHVVPKVRHSVVVKQGKQSKGFAKSQALKDIARKQTLQLISSQQVCFVNIGIDNMY